MKLSGYSQNYRLQILKSSKGAYKNILIEDENGTKPLYRSRNWNKLERKKSKADKRINWFRSKKADGTNYNSVLFDEATPGGVLVKQLTKREAELNKDNPWRIKMVEQAGAELC